MRITSIASSFQLMHFLASSWARLVVSRASARAQKHFCLRLVEAPAASQPLSANVAEVALKFPGAPFHKLRCILHSEAVLAVRLLHKALYDMRVHD